MGVVAIAGAAGGLGPVVAARLASEGARLALAGRNAARLEALGLAGADIQAVDLMDEVAVRAWAEGLVERYGGVDAVLHLVGGWRGGTPIEQAPLEDWDALAGPLVGTLQRTSQAFAGPLIASRGRFVLASTGQAQAPTSTNAAYAAAKAAAEAWTLALADRFRGTGATANIVVIGGALVTPAMRAEKPGDLFQSGTPAEDVAAAIAYLLSAEAGRVNGQRLILRGAY